MFVTRDGNTIYNNSMENPAAVFDKSTGTLYKIGDFDVLKPYYDEIVKLYQDAGYHAIARDIELLELPRDQDEIDKVFTHSGYIKTLFDKLNL